MNHKIIKGILLCMLMLSLCIILCILFQTPYLGAADNGDFGRIGTKIGLHGMLNWEANDRSVFWSYVREEWPWLPFDGTVFTPENVAFSSVIPLTVVRLLVNLFSDTSQTPLFLPWLACAYVLMLMIACLWIFRFCICHLKGWFIILFPAFIIVFLNKMHLAWFNSLYGEAMMYIGILLCIGCALETISARRGSTYGLIMSVVMSGCTYCLVMSKPQSVLSLFMWFGASASMLMYHSKGVKAFCRSRRVLTLLCACIIAFNTIHTLVCSVAFYRWNSKLVEKDTIYQSITYGALLLTDQPEQMCIEMGIDPIIAKDMGKDAYRDTGEYVTPPRSAEAEERLYSKINTFSLLRYYITHPKYLIDLLERAAGYAVSPATMLHMNYDASGELANARTFGTMWQKIRPMFVPRHFQQYVVLYLILFSVCIKKWITNKGKPENRLLIYAFVAVMGTGILQYPLPVIGNGFADVNKQLYLFMLCYDITIFTVAGYMFFKLINYCKNKVW